MNPVAMAGVAGAAIAFLMAAGGTSIPAAIAVFALVKRAMVALKVALGLAGSFAIASSSRHRAVDGDTTRRRVAGA